MPNLNIQCCHHEENTFLSSLSYQIKPLLLRHTIYQLGIAMRHFILMHIDTMLEYLLLAHFPAPAWPSLISTDLAIIVYSSNLDWIYVDGSVKLSESHCTQYYNSYTVIREGPLQWICDSFELGRLAWSLQEYTRIYIGSYWTTSVVTHEVFLHGIFV